MFGQSVFRYSGTPGRFDDETENAQLDNADISVLSVSMVEKLGGAQNISVVDSCITRLRLTVKNAAIINEDELKALGAAGVMNEETIFRLLLVQKQKRLLMK